VALTFDPSGSFRRDLEDRVAAYFDARQLSRRDCPQMYVKTAVLVLWLAASYIGLVFMAQAWWQAVPLSLSLALAMAGIGFNVQHDGNHGAYSRHPWVNKTMALSLNLLGGNAYFWHYKHNIAHHTFPNISGSDDDISLGPLGRLSPHDRHYWFHRFQHLYIWFLYAMLAIEWQLTGDFRSMIKPGVADTRVARPRGREQLFFWAGKACFFALALVVPLLRHGFWTVVGFYFLTGAVLGLTLSIVFQLAHCIEETTFRIPEAGSQRIGRDFYTHQVETSADFARGSRLWTWYLGGLNFQVEHHLFPKICHVHYPALSPIVEQTCSDHGVPYLDHPSVSSAVRSHVRLLKRLSRRPQPRAEAQPQADPSYRNTSGNSGAPATTA
jgi:linoleoyl-CoA desaturase